MKVHVILSLWGFTFTQEISKFEQYQRARIRNVKSCFVLLYEIFEISITFYDLWVWQKTKNQKIEKQEILSNFAQILFKIC